MNYVLGAKSRRELVGVEKPLVDVVHRAIQITEQDFTVFDGIRSAVEQNKIYLAGASQLDGYKKISNHQLGRAVDLVPWINNKPRWEWEPIFKIARAMQIASEELNVPLTWGGSWSRLTGAGKLPEQLNREYVERRLRAGRKAFPDGPHYEL